MKTRADAERYIREETDSHGKLSQRARILRLLLTASEIPLPMILAMQIGQYNARIKELRSLGFDIRNRTAHPDGQVHSWYSLVSDPNSGSCDWFQEKMGKPRPTNPAADFGPLFGNADHL
jgi:hypothetical protein